MTTPLPRPSVAYLFDTDTISDLVRDRPSRRLLSRLERTPLDAQFIASVTLGELLYGAYKNYQESKRFLAAIEELLEGDFRIVSFDESAARAYGPLRADLERAGTPIGDRDVQIAAIALANGLTLVTGNVRHFQQVPGLRLVNWLA